MSLAAPSLFTGSVFAVATAVLPKSAGSMFRINDNWNAKKPLRENTINGEILTLGQVGGYAVIGKAISNFLKRHSAQFERLARNEGVVALVIACLSNVAAETVSRKFFKRKIDADNQVVSKDKAVQYSKERAKERDDDDEDDHHPHVVSEKSQSFVAIPAYPKNNPFAQGSLPLGQDVMFAQAPTSFYGTAHYAQSPFQVRTF